MFPRRIAAFFPEYPMSDNNNIRHILESWPYDPEEDLMTRLVDTDEGVKLQMRVDMGIIQIELDGNPNGEKPAGCESWFEHFLARQEETESSEVDDYFTLGEHDCKLLRREAVRYYYRYLCLMKLGDYERVIRDTDRNYRLFAFIKKYATREIDRWSLDQYRPYVIMMNTRARASLAVQRHDRDSGDGSHDTSSLEDALKLINKGIDNIADFFEEYGIASEMEDSVELSILTALKNEFLRSLPLTLEDQLKQAVEEERFEDAARLRDMIKGAVKNG